MSRPKTIHIIRQRGDTYGFSFTVGADLTGYTVVVNVDTEESVEPDDETTRQFQLTTTVTPGASSSTVAVTAPSEVQADLAPATYYYDAIATAGAVVRTFARGKWVVE